MSNDAVPGGAEDHASAPMTPDTRGTSPQYVVGIGASAGGLEPLERFFDNLPRDTGMAFVIVQHLSPDFKSLMDELLGAAHAAADPPRRGRHARRAGPRLPDPAEEGDDHLGRPAAPERARSPAGADAADRRLLPLAGAGLRRARGRDRAVRRRQRRLARHPRQSTRRAGWCSCRTSTARSSTACRGRRAKPASSPMSLPPQEMPRVLLEHASAAIGRRTGGRARPPGAHRPRRRLSRCWKTSSASTSRTTSRARSPGASSGGSRSRRSPTSRSTCARLRSEREELDVLYRDLLIGVTRFFRDEEAFALLEERVLPELLAARARATRRCGSGSPAARRAKRRTRWPSCCTS